MEKFVNKNKKDDLIKDGEGSKILSKLNLPNTPKVNKPNVLVSVPKLKDLANKKEIKNSNNLKNILISSRVIQDSDLEVIPMKSSGNIAYKWNKDQVFAGAKKSKWDQSKSFMEQVDTYLNIIKNQCGSSSKSDLGLIKTNRNGNKILDANIECKIGGDNPVASFLFYGSKKDNHFTVFSHETTKANIIDAERDKVRIKDILLNGT